jgi:acyl carrier protein
MNKNKIIDILINILKKKNIKLNKIGKNKDLYENGIIDSFDVIDIIERIDDFFQININLANKKKIKFSINYLADNILKKLK